MCTKLISPEKLKPSIASNVGSRASFPSVDVSIFANHQIEPEQSFIPDMEKHGPGDITFEGQNPQSFDWWNNNLWQHLDTDFGGSSVYNQSGSSINESDYADDYEDRYGNYEKYDTYSYFDEAWLHANESMINDLKMWNVLSSYFIQQKGSNNQTATNHTDHPHKNAINPFHTLSNFTENLNTSISFENFFRPSLRSGKRNETNEDVLSYFPNFKIQYPAWENLSLKQQNSVLNMTQGEPQRYGFKVTTGLIVYYGVLLSVGIPGNGLTCLIILTNSYMRTAPNIFLLNIAIADLVTLVMGK